MKVRDYKRAAAGILLTALILLCCVGCKDQEDSLQTLSLEKNETAEEDETVEDAGQQEKTAEASEADSKEQETTAENETVIFVYVCGAVRTPGVYELGQGARIYEAIALAGGVREDAAEEYVNQAQSLSDGERIYIPTNEEVQQKDFSWKTDSAGSIAAEDGSTGAADKDGKIDINTASEEELKTLTGIGDTRAKSIVEYRNAGGVFRQIEDLMNVDGIKEGVFNKIKDRITVNAGSK